MKQRSNSCAVASVVRFAAACVMTAALASGVLVAAATVSGEAPSAGASSLAAGGCTAKAITGATTLDLKIENTASGKLPTVSVCIDGKGPFRFLVSTGAGSSVLTPSLVRSLGLTKKATSAVRGVTCTAAAPTVKVKHWSIAGRKLASQKLLVAPVSAPGASPTPRGIIGSDVLARFGAVRIDYQASRLVLLGKERARPKGNVYVLGTTTAAPPAALAKGGLKVSASLRVFESPQGTIVAAPVKIAGHTEQLAVDSGSAGSDLLPAVARTLKLRASAVRAAYAGVGCSGTAPTYASGAWALGKSALPAADLVARPIAGSLNSGLQGVLGSDVLATDGATIIDYEGAHLWLAGG